jgi:hypothetical protein
VKCLSTCVRLAIVTTALAVFLVAQARASPSKIVCRKELQTSNNCYRLVTPAQQARGLVVVLPYFGSDATEFSDAKLPQLLSARGIATMVVSAGGYLQDSELVTLKALIGEAVRTLGLPAKRLIVGGVSAGGTGAVRYAEYCISGHCDARTAPVAVFSVDAPLDFVAYWNRETLNLRRDDPKSSPDESAAVLKALQYTQGGSPAQVPQVYRRRSAFIATEKGGANARFLRSIPIRLYTEPDIIWDVEHAGRDYYTLNAVDQAALFLQLRALGNTKAELIVTSGKGFRPPGKRNPHSWTIVDEPKLADWIVRNLGG